MRGEIGNFKGRIGDTMKKVLNNYSPEIEIALGPARVIFRARNNKTLIKEPQIDMDGR